MTIINFIFPFIIVFLGLILPLILIKNRISNTKNKKLEPDPYYLNRNLLSDCESHFYEALYEAINDRYLICPKVRLADIIGIRKGINKNNFYTHFNKISRKHFDFVMCDPFTQKVEFVIELDDRSHVQDKAWKNDQFKNKTCKQIGLPLLRFKARREYEPKLIALELEEQLNIELPLSPEEKEQLRRQRAIRNFQKPPEVKS